MKKTNIIILAGLSLACISTFECFAPNKKKTGNPQEAAPQSTTLKDVEPAAPQELQPVALITPKETEPVQPATLKDAQAFKYLRTAIPDLPTCWTLFTSAKHPMILNLLRDKKLQAAIEDPTQRTRKEHDLDWAITECMNTAYNKDLAEIFMRCAEQDVKINESSLHAASTYCKIEMAREFTALKKNQDEVFARIKTLKATERLAKNMLSLTLKDSESDVEDYDDQHMFDKTRAIEIAPRAAAPTLPLSTPEQTAPQATK